MKPGCQDPALFQILAPCSQSSGSCYFSEPEFAVSGFHLSAHPAPLARIHNSNSILNLCKYLWTPGLEAYVGYRRISTCAFADNCCRRGLSPSHSWETQHGAFKKGQDFLMRCLDPAQEMYVGADPKAFVFSHICPAPPVSGVTSDGRELQYWIPLMCRCYV